MPNYSPYDHAKALSLTVYFRPLDRWSAVWFPDQRTLVLRQNMTEQRERLVLACAVAHVESGSREPVITVTPATVPLIAAKRLLGKRLPAKRHELTRAFTALTLTAGIAASFCGATELSTLFA